MAKIKYKPIKEDDKFPICPHCEKPIEEMRYFEQEGLVAMKVARLFVCPHCMKVLGVGMVGM
jgi:hypothetical protein